MEKDFTSYRELIVRMRVFFVFVILVFVIIVFMILVFVVLVFVVLFLLFTVTVVMSCVVLKTLLLLYCIIEKYSEALHTSMRVAMSSMRVPMTMGECKHTNQVNQQTLPTKYASKEMLCTKRGIGNMYQS